MGWLRSIFSSNNAEGCRKAMMKSYEKHARSVEVGDVHVAEESPHNCGLYGALGTRYLAHGTQPDEFTLMSELVPFQNMQQSFGKVMLAEYVVFKEWKEEAAVDLLKLKVNEALRAVSPEEDDCAFGVAYAIIHKIAWTELLEPDVRIKFKSKIEKMRKELKTNT